MSVYQRDLFLARILVLSQMSKRSELEEFEKRHIDLVLFKLFEQIQTRTIPSEIQDHGGDKPKEVVNRGTKRGRPKASKVGSGQNRIEES